MGSDGRNRILYFIMDYGYYGLREIIYMVLTTNIVNVKFCMFGSLLINRHKGFG